MEFSLSHQEELMALIRALCAIPAPSHHEQERAAFCKAWFEQQGMEAYIDSALNVVCPVNCENSSEITVFAAHIDTVFPDLTPMPFHEDEEKMYCPGVGDDTANVAMLMLAAREAVRQCPKPEKGWLFVLDSCEEGLGNLKGCRKIMEDYAGRVACLYAFDGGYDYAVNKPVGSTRYRVTVKTPGGHSYSKFGQPNAIAVMASIIDKLYALPLPAQGRTTFNVGTISGGTSVNTIAQQAEMLYEFRSEERENLAAMEQAFEQVLQAHRTEKIQVEVEVLGRRPCMGDVDRDKQAALEEKVASCIETLVGKRPVFVTGSTDCNIPLSVGVPAVCFGGYRGQGSHTREEQIDKKSMEVGLEVIYQAILGTK